MLFDLDGTLTESAPGILRSAEYACQQMGWPVPPKEELRTFIGPPLYESFQRCCGAEPEQAKEAVEHFRRRYTSIGQYENSLYEGVEELLCALKAAGCLVAVATAKAQPFAENIVRHFHLMPYLEEVSGARLADEHVAKEELIKRVLAHTGIPKSRAVMVGDTHYDVLGAKNAGVAFIGVLYGYGTREELLAYGAGCLVQSTSELRRALLGE